MELADLVITGRVATLAGDSGLGWSDGFAIGRGRVLRVGSDADLTELIGPRTERWRLPADLAVMPGITDAHLHLMTLVLAEGQVDLTGLDLATTLDAIAERHQAMAADGDTAGWLLGHGWSAHAIGGWPDADALESVAPGRPMALWAHDHHSRWISHEAMRRAGFASAEPTGSTESTEGELIRRDEQGRATGVLHESAAVLVDHAIPDPSEEEIEQRLRRVAGTLAALGLTGCHDPGELTDDRDMVRGPLIYRRLAERGRLPLRVHGSVRAPQLERAASLGLRSGQRTGRFTVGWLKLFSDGSLGSRSAALLEPYDDAATNPPTGGPAGMVRADRTDLDELLTAAAGAGIVGQVHAIGDAAVRLALDALAAAPAVAAATGDASLMRRVEHAQLVDPADQPRFGALGVAASVQPVHLRSDTDQARIAWGTRAEHAFPLRGLLDAGALIPFGTDAPIEPADPWPGIAVAVTRRDPNLSDEPALGGAHAIDLARAIRAACVDPAQVAGLDDVGRLTPGSRADLLVVPAVALDERVRDPRRLAAVRPLVTVIDGEVVHRTDGFDAG
jgi:predicted amidohydrolase YtcJ